MAGSDQRRIQLVDVRAFVGDVYGTDLHAKPIDSSAGATPRGGWPNSDSPISGKSA
jgi:hypothetical protein